MTFSIGVLKGSTSSAALPHISVIFWLQGSCNGRVVPGGCFYPRSLYRDGKRCNNAFLYEAIAIANDCDLNYRISKNKRLMLELMLIKLCQLNEKGTVAKDEKRV